MVCVSKFCNHLFHPTAACDVFPDHSALSVKTIDPGAGPTGYFSYVLLVFRFSLHVHTLWNETFDRSWREAAKPLLVGNVDSDYEQCYKINLV